MVSAPPTLNPANTASQFLRRISGSGTPAHRARRRRNGLGGHYALPYIPNGAGTPRHLARCPGAGRCGLTCACAAGHLPTSSSCWRFWPARWRCVPGIASTSPPRSVTSHPCLPRRASLRDRARHGGYRHRPAARVMLERAARLRTSPGGLASPSDRHRPGDPDRWSHQAAGRPRGRRDLHDDLRRRGGEHRPPSPARVPPAPREARDRDGGPSAGALRRARLRRRPRAAVHGEAADRRGLDQRRLLRARDTCRSASPRIVSPSAHQDRPGAAARGDIPTCTIVWVAASEPEAGSRREAHVRHPLDEDRRVREERAGRAGFAAIALSALLVTGVAYTSYQTVRFVGQRPVIRRDYDQTRVFPLPYNHAKLDWFVRPDAPEPTAPARGHQEATREPVRLHWAAADPALRPLLSSSSSPRDRRDNTAESFPRPTRCRRRAAARTPGVCPSRRTRGGTDCAA